MAVEDFLQLIPPFLLVHLALCRIASWLHKEGFSSFPARLLILFISLLVSFTPVFPLSLAELVLSLIPHFSLGSFYLLLFLLAPCYCPKVKLIFFYKFLWLHLIISLILYLSYFDMIPVDLYYYGYGVPPFFCLLLFINLVLVWTATPLAIILLSYSIAFLLHLLPSGNFFDYFTDGFLFCSSLALIIYRIWKGGTPDRGSGAADPDPFPAPGIMSSQNPGSRG